MDWPTKCAAVIPCFNEAASIRDVIAGVRRRVAHVVVVDDGSTDDTLTQARLAGAEVLRHARNCGKGAALSTGLRHAHTLGFAWALTLDGDGQHSPIDIPVFFDCVRRTHVALVVGERMSRAEAMPWLRRHVNQWMSRQISLLAGMPLADTQCGYRLMNLDSWSRLSLRTRRFEVESELLMAFALAGLRIEFVPIQVIYGSEKSNISKVVDTCRWLRWWVDQRRYGANAIANQTSALRASITTRLP
jgi:glycosyltransferase involved in cell wall biosynthesis